MTTVWPREILVPHSIGFNRRLISRGGGPSLNGVEQVVQSASDHWEAQLSLRLNRQYRIIAFRATMNALDGRYGKILVPTYAGFFTLLPQVYPYNFSSRYVGRGRSRFRDTISLGSGPLGSAPLGSSGITTVDETSTFSDTSEFSDDLVGTLDAPVAAQSVELDVTMPASDTPPIAGLYFTIAEKLYIIISSEPNSGNSYHLTFRPWLRADAAAGDLLNFSNTVCRMRLATDDAAALSLEALRTGTANLSFIEDPDL